MGITIHDIFFLTIIWSGVYLSHYLAGKTKLTPVLYFLEFVAMDMGYVQNSILTTHPFSTLLVTAFMLNVTVPVSIKYWKPYFEGAKQLKVSVGGNAFDLSKEDL